MVAVRNWELRIFRSNFFALSTYFYIALAAGHNLEKYIPCSVFCAAASGILPFLHPQKVHCRFHCNRFVYGASRLLPITRRSTDYLFIALGFLFISELVRAIQGKTEWKHFGIASGILAFAFLLLVLE